MRVLYFFSKLIFLFLFKQKKARSDVVSIDWKKSGTNNNQLTNSWKNGESLIFHLKTWLKFGRKKTPILKCVAILIALPSTFPIHRHRWSKFPNNINFPDRRIWGFKKLPIAPSAWTLLTFHDLSSSHIYNKDCSRISTTDRTRRSTISSRPNNSQL